MLLILQHTPVAAHVHPHDLAVGALGRCIGQGRVRLGRLRRNANRASTITNATSLSRSTRGGMTRVGGRLDGGGRVVEAVVERVSRVDRRCGSALGVADDMRKDVLRRHLQRLREGVLWKLDGLSER